MELEERLQRLHAHVQENPKDYQSVISELKMRSKVIEHERHLAEIERLRAVAEIRKRRKEAEDEEQR